MSAPPERHHYVPQFYLRGFAANSQLGKVDLRTGSRFTTSVRASAMSFGFYEVPAQTANPNVFEQQFSKFEGQADAVFKRVAAGEWPLHPDARLILSNFVAFQALRGPEQRQMMLDMQGKQVSREMRRAEEVGAAQWIRERLRLSLEEERAQRLWERAMAEGASEFPVDAFFHIRQIASLVEKAQPFLLSRRWKLVRFEQPMLLTSDAPVSLNPSVGDSRKRLGLGTAGDVVFPMNRHLALIMGDAERGTSCADAARVASGSLDRVVRGTASAQRFVNDRTARRANEALFYHPADASHLTADNLSQRR